MQPSYEQRDAVGAIVCSDGGIEPSEPGMSPSPPATLYDVDSRPRPSRQAMGLALRWYRFTQKHTHKQRYTQRFAVRIRVRPRIRGAWLLYAVQGEREACGLALRACSAGLPPSARQANFALDSHSDPLENPCPVQRGSAEDVASARENLGRPWP